MKLIFGLLIISIWNFLTTNGYSLGKPEKFSTPDSLKMVSIIFRHGHRAPYELYKTDPFYNFPWHAGVGGLSRRGMRDMYKLGTTLRARYGGLLPENGYYTPEVLMFNSSNVERTIVSASSAIAGLMPPPDNEPTLPFPWQPVPIHTLPDASDQYIQQTRPCAKYDKDFERALQFKADEVSKKPDEKEFYEMVSKNTDTPIRNSYELIPIQNTIFIQQLAGFPFPSWVTNDIYKKMTKLVQDAWLTFTYTPFMKAIKGGPLVTEIYERMASKNAGNETRKLFIYSGHDDSLVAVMDALSVVDQAETLPDFGATLTFELHENHELESGMEVKVFYLRSNLDTYFKQIKLPGCPEPCSLHHFNESISDIYIKGDEQFEAMCRPLH